MSDTIQPLIPGNAVPQSRSDSRVADARGVYASEAAVRGAGAGYRTPEIGTLPIDWNLHPLGSLYRFSNGVNADKEAYGQGTPFINVLEVITNSHLQERHIPGKVLLSKTARDTFAVLPGDVLFNRTSETQEEVGLSAVYCGHAPVVFGGFVIRGRAVGNLLDATYAGYGLRARSVRRQIVAQGQGAIRSNIGQASLRRVQVPLPTLDEQRAIAEALSDADDLLGALDALIAKKRAIKQAAMQQLLTGKTRLPGFSKEWSTESLRDLVATPISDGPHLTPTFRESGVPFLSVNNLVENRLDFSSLRYISMEDHLEFSRKCRPQKGDILFGKAASVGMVALIDTDIELNIWSPLALIRADRTMDARFVCYALQTLSVERQIKLLTNASSQGNIGMSDIGRLTIPVPPLVEQTEIARVLADMDSELVELKRRRDKILSIKQGMIQQLLTGRVRLVRPSAEAEEAASS